MASAPLKSSTMWLACIRSLLLLLLLFVPRLIYAASNHVKVWTARTRCDSCEITETSQTLHQCLFMRWRAPPSWERTIKTDCLPSVWPFVRLSAINNSAPAPVIRPPHLRFSDTPRVHSLMPSAKIRNLKTRIRSHSASLSVPPGGRRSAALMSGVSRQVPPRSWATQTGSWRRTNGSSERVSEIKNSPGGSSLASGSKQRLVGLCSEGGKSAGCRDEWKTLILRH